LDRLEQSSSQSRDVLVLALAGFAAQSREPAVPARLEKLLASAQGGERDALLGLLGRVPTAEAVATEARIVERSRMARDRAKFAEALAAHPGEDTRLVALLVDPAESVRANAAWSLGEIGSSADLPVLEHALADANVDVAGNALEAMARIARRNKGRIAALACARVSEPRPMLRAVALRALRFNAERCEHGEELAALAHDRNDFARKSAAALLRDVSRGKRDAEALAQARDHDPSSAVAAECDGPAPPAPNGVDATSIFVIPPGEDMPAPEQPFALLRADGLVRLGVSDRRGEVFEVKAPHGSLSLVETASGFE
ncbi:MAG TPA: HEAT repeat domain-containing protein, partial [Polyangiaceae bacterium]|nr:HEAT repeat domain-containing protein [Polyangiaceae bacterium]